MAGLAQCHNCGAWRTKGIELLTHVQICKGFRCPYCGHPAHNGHECHAPGVRGFKIYRTPEGYEAFAPGEPNPYA